MKNIILTYHNIVQSREGMRLYDVAYSDFEEQMKLLHALPGACVSTVDAVMPSDAVHVTLTFDDGYASWAHETLAVLTRYRFTAYFFVCVENLYKWGSTENADQFSISKDDIRRLRKAGMIIGSHGMKHRFLHELESEEIGHELSRSKKVLEDLLGEGVRYFSVPRGMYNQKVVDLAKDAGYERVFTSDIGINNESGYLLKRIPIRRYTRINGLKDIVSGKGIAVMAFGQSLKNGAKAVFGMDRYNILRKMVVPRAE